MAAADRDSNNITLEMRDGAAGAVTNGCVGVDEMKNIAVMLAIVATLAGCASSQTASSREVDEHLVQMRSMVEKGEYEKAAAFFERHSPGMGCDEFRLLGCRTYRCLAEKESDPKKRDELLKKAVRALNVI